MKPIEAWQSTTPRARRRVLNALSAEALKDVSCAAPHTVVNPAVQRMHLENAEAYRAAVRVLRIVERWSKG